MKKFINEYKALRSKSETETSKNKARCRSAVESPVEMGVFKWLRRERVTVSVSSDAIPSQESPNASQSDQVGTIRTEEYKRHLAEFQARRSLGNKEVDLRQPTETEEYKKDLAEFQARRSFGSKEKIEQEKPELPVTPVKKKCGRHALPCTDCSTAHDNTFSYEKKSAVKYKKKARNRTKSMNTDDRGYEGLPSIQFLFQNQVFMPGNYCSTFSEPQRTKQFRKTRRTPICTAPKQIDFNEDGVQESSPIPIFFKNNSLPIDPKCFLDGSMEEVDGVKMRVSSQSSEDDAVGKKAGVNEATDDKLWEVMSELKNLDQWADEQLQGHNSSAKSDDSKISSDISACGLPIASACNLDVERNDRVWNQGKWGVVPVQIKKLANVSVDMVKKKANVEINILRKYRHPNIILLMGLYPDFQNNIHIICEQCIDSLYGILHVQGRILSAQTSVHYALDITNALVFLRMQGFIHTGLTSHSIMVTNHDAAKLADLGPCTKLVREKPISPKNYDQYSPEPHYVNIDASNFGSTPESEPLISKHSSETYLATNSVAKEYKGYRESEHYRWQAPELFEPDEMQFVHPCVKSDVYSLCLILWECCNAAVPWKTLTYEKLKELYVLWKTGIRLPQDGTYPGCLLSLLQSGLTLSRENRIDLTVLHSTLVNVKTKINDMEYIIIPARMSKKKSDFSVVAWDTNSPTDDSESLSPVAVQNGYHKAVVHNNNSSPDTSEKDAKSDSSAIYETIRKDKHSIQTSPQKCLISDEEPSDEQPIIKYEHLPERDISSACSTPIAKIRARIKDIGTPGALHRSDSTEYCSILSPDNRHFAIDDSAKDSTEKAAAKLSRSFTPKSYKPLHITVPEFNLDSVKSILKDVDSKEKKSYNFDIKNYSLPATPIARSNKLRKNAWLSGDVSVPGRMTDKLNENQNHSFHEKLKELTLQTPVRDTEPHTVRSAPETSISGGSNNSSPEKAHSLKTYDLSQSPGVEERSPETDCLERESFTILRQTEPVPDSPSSARGRPSWPRRSPPARPTHPTHPTHQLSDEALAKVNVKPLVAIHERWIYEANRKTARSMSLPEDNRNLTRAVKPASHCVDMMQKSLPQLNTKRSVPKQYKSHPISPASSGKSGSHWDSFCQAREAVARGINFGTRDQDRYHSFSRDHDKGTSTIGSPEPRNDLKVDQATDTRSIEDFIRDLIRKEFQHILHEISEDANATLRSEEILNKGVSNIVENLKTEGNRKESKSFSRVKINGNNKPLLHITFSRCGENTLQVLDNCVNVTISEGAVGGAKERERDQLNVSLEETLTADDGRFNSLKRCQAFSAIQEARSTEDLYIDDDLSTQMQENFGGRVKLIPLHGSLHEILCEREDDCCLLKVKQENGCDTIYFRCDNSDTESRDAIDGSARGGTSPHPHPQDTVVYKRSISLVEERIQRIYPKRTQTPAPTLKTQTVETKIRLRPKSEVFPKPITDDTRIISASSPSLIMKEKDKTDAVEVNIENVMEYQDSSSDECLRCQFENDDFELLEKKIEADIANSLSNRVCACLSNLPKISEENLYSACECEDAVIDVEEKI